MVLIIDGKRANLAPALRCRGLGMISGNHSSRLLLDYKAEHPAQYQQLLQLIFGADGLRISHLKLELGADIDSSSGTEPAVKRTADEPADVTRGAGFQLAADAKAVNPALTLDLLWWSEPRWVSAAPDRYAARYRWIRETLAAAYAVYGLRFDYLSANRNERALEPEWICYLSEQFKAETVCPYPYAEIRIVAADEENSWRIADAMLTDERLLSAVDVIGSHYASRATDNVATLAYEFGKEVWFSEGSAPMQPPDARRFSPADGGLGGVGGLLDIANRIIAMYPQGDMTLYEFQPLVAAYYDGATYCHKQLITAQTPWNGHFTLDSGFFLGLHFAQLLRKGWAFVDGACHTDGVPGGDGHAIVDATCSYLTAADPETGDFATVLTNCTAQEIVCHWNIRGLRRAGAPLFVRETCGNPTLGLFREAPVLHPICHGEIYTCTLRLKPCSLVTVSTLACTLPALPQTTSALLPLPYREDFSAPPAWLAARGGAPLYFSDAGGAFAVLPEQNPPALTQCITPDLRAEEWGATPEPTTQFGDDRWLDYCHTATLLLADAAPETYAGVGVRFFAADSGVRLLLFADGRWLLDSNRSLLAEGKIVPFDAAVPHTLSLSATQRQFVAACDETLLTACTAAEVSGAGRAVLYSSYARNRFLRTTLTPTARDYAVRRFDSLADCLQFSPDGWTHSLCGSYRDYHRARADGTSGAVVTLTFAGTGFACIGRVDADGCVLSVRVDGHAADTATLSPSAHRVITCLQSGLQAELHTAEITVVRGTWQLDAVEIIGGC